MSEFEIVENTAISEIYDNFLSKISDYGYVSDDVTDEEIEEEMFSFFKSARAKFQKCRKSLKVETNEEDETFFLVALTDYEIEIITTLMLAEYLKPYVLGSDVLKQSLSDKNFKIYSQANQLRELSLTYRMIKKEAEKMITKYTYNPYFESGEKDDKE